MFKLTPFNTSSTQKDAFTDFADIMDDFFNTPFRSLRHDSFKIDVEEQDNQYLIHADLPGVKKDEIKVSYDDQTLNIEIQRDEKKEEDEKDKNYLHRERRVCAMRRSIHLPNIDPSKLKAKLEDGVLKILAQKTEVRDQGYMVEVE